ncbi:MAG: hypothetical protein FFODKBPE_00643 [Candidatus Argoarchaeum ethanivorans]|uniref:Uncharacterized protein n=1 Tax=Candidatus Argoarchaeum ethanivorans TaxID=2608793 RepID=A0A811TEL3_9EURY|nr:MAG: hypothetical protein FFODKBPE_00643 [Candidatus Argoarchaeum ethanivorans]
MSPNFIRRWIGWGFNGYKKVVKNIRKKIMPCFIVIVLLASMFSGCIEEKPPESNYQKWAEGEWQPPNPDAFKRAADNSRKIEEWSKKHDDHLVQLVNDINANNERIDQWSKEHDARINELNSKMTEQSARIDQWSKDHNDRINELNIKIIEQNANIDELVKDIATQNAKTCEEVKKLQANLNNAAAQNTELCKKMEGHNACMDGHIKKIEDHNARIDQWSKDYNARLNELEGDIEARNAAICEASIEAQEHIDALSEEINNCLEDVIHIWEDIAIDLITPGIGDMKIPGAEELIRNLLKIEQREYHFKKLSYLAGVVSSVTSMTVLIPLMRVNEINAQEIERLGRQTPELAKITKYILQFRVEYNKNMNTLVVTLIRKQEAVLVLIKKFGILVK